MVGYATLVDRREAERLEQIAAEASEVAPPWAAPYILKAAPAAGILGAIAEVLGPAVYQFYAGLYKIYKKLPTNVARCFYGLGVCFYGGRYPLTLAAAQAFRLTGGSEMVGALETIKVNVRAAQQAAEQDKNVSSDNKMRRKLAVALGAVEPSELSNAVGSLWSGYLGVLAALRLKFARTTALAHSVGDSLRPAAAKFLGPTLLAVTPAERHKWVSPALNVFCKILGMTVAWKLGQTLSTLQSALIGGLLAARSGLVILREQEIVALDADKTMVDDVCGWCLAAAGIHYQLIQGGTAPAVFLPALWPLGFLELCLQWSVAFLGNSDGGASSP